MGPPVRRPPRQQGPSNGLSSHTTTPITWVPRPTSVPEPAPVSSWARPSTSPHGVHVLAGLADIAVEQEFYRIHGLSPEQLAQMGNRLERLPLRRACLAGPLRAAAGRRPVAARHHGRRGAMLRRPLAGPDAALRARAMTFSSRPTMCWRRSPPNVSGRGGQAEDDPLGSTSPSLSIIPSLDSGFDARAARPPAPLLRTAPPLHRTRGAPRRAMRRHRPLLPARSAADCSRDRAASLHDGARRPPVLVRVQRDLGPRQHDGATRRAGDVPERGVRALASVREPGRIGFDSALWLGRDSGLRQRPRTGHPRVRPCGRVS